MVVLRSCFAPVNIWRRRLCRIIFRWAETVRGLPKAAVVCNFHAVGTVAVARVASEKDCFCLFVFFLFPVHNRLVSCVRGLALRSHEYRHRSLWCAWLAAAECGIILGGLNVHEWRLLFVLAFTAVYPLLTGGVVGDGVLYSASRSWRWWPHGRKRLSYGDFRTGWSIPAAQLCAGLLGCGRVVHRLVRTELRSILLHCRILQHDIQHCPAGAWPLGWV